MKDLVFPGILLLGNNHIFSKFPFLDSKTLNFSTFLIFRKSLVFSCASEIIFFNPKVPLHEPIDNWFRVFCLGRKQCFFSGYFLEFSGVLYENFRKILEFSEILIENRWVIHENTKGICVQWWENTQNFRLRRAFVKNLPFLEITRKILDFSNP